jgi:hypothetical protein
MGIIEEIFAKGATEVYKQVPPEKMAAMKAASLKMEAGLHRLNADWADDALTPEEFEGDMKEIMDDMGSMSGGAFQAWFWSLFKHA